MTARRTLPSCCPWPPCSQVAMAPAAHAGDAQLSVMMDDDQLVYSGDATRDAALHEDEGARRRLGPRHGPVERRGRRRAEEPGRAASASTGSAPPTPRAYPQAQLGPLRPARPRARRRSAHRLLLQRHRARRRAGATPSRRARYERARPPRRGCPSARDVQAVRRGGRQALLRPLPRRERRSRPAPAGLVLVAVERAQPGAAGWRPQWYGPQALLAVAVPRLYYRRPPGRWTRPATAAT